MGLGLLSFNTFHIQPSAPGHGRVPWGKAQVASRFRIQQSFLCNHYPLLGKRTSCINYDIGYLYLWPTSHLKEEMATRMYDAIPKRAKNMILSSSRLSGCCVVVLQDADGVARPTYKDFQSSFFQPPISL